MSSRPDMPQRNGYCHYMPGLEGHAYSACFLERLATGMEKGGTDMTLLGPKVGYTYLAQFVAHDLTHIQGSDAEAHGQPRPIRDIANRSTPQLDLSPLYGAGFYDKGIKICRQTGLFKLGVTLNNAGQQLTGGDLYRVNKKAVIADKRNDDNLILAQLHLLFMRAHNAILLNYFSNQCAEEAFRSAGAVLTKLYHNIVFYDLLKTLCDEKIWNYFFVKNGPSLWCREKGAKLSLPVEFATAAYRFGHSMVQASYKLNSNETNVGIKELITLTGDKGLDGASHLSSSYSIDWARFFSLPVPDISPNHARGISPSFTPFASLTNLRQSTSNIAYRNLKRANQMQCASAQHLISKINHSSKLPFKLKVLPRAALDPQSYKIFLQSNLSFGMQMTYFANTPLWVYILCEALDRSRSGLSDKLGELGSLLVADVIKNCAHNTSIPINRGDNPNCSTIQSMSDLITSFDLQQN